MPPEPQTVLVAEDNPVERKLLTFRLSQLGYRVVAAADGVEALERTRSTRPDLVVSDVLMPRLDGFRLCQRLRQDAELGEIPVVLISSATIEEDDRLLALEMGANALVLRTPDCQHIVEAVRVGLEEGAPPLPAEDQDLVPEMRERFVTEGSTEARLTLESLEVDFDAQAIKQRAHRWAGVGGTLGFAQISQLAYQIEGLCERPSEEAAAELRLRLAELLNLFSDAARRRPSAPEMPVEVQEALAGKQVALVGFAETDAPAMCRALEQAGARVSRLPALETPPGSPALAQADLVILFLEAEGRASPWTDPRALSSSDRPLLVVGNRDALFHTGAVTRKYAGDFLLDPWSPEEALLRASRVLRRHRRWDQLAAHPGRGAPILVADDDPTMCVLVSETLGNYGLPCRLARDGAETLELVEKLRPSLLILDINLPDVDGFEVLMQLQQGPAGQNLPVVLLSARQQEADVLRGFALGASDYVVKPFSPLELVARVRRLLRP